MQHKFQVKVALLYRKMKEDFDCVQDPIAQNYKFIWYVFSMYTNKK